MWNSGDDWDLRAVVRGCCSSAQGVEAAAPDPWAVLSPLLLDDGVEDGLGFPDLVATETAMQELEELCKPFFHKPVEVEMETPAAVVQPAVRVPTRRTTPSQIARAKRRKSQLKRVVCEVPAEGLTSDVWAWRKYGQKPIKGSPYPRGYYRCSSSKGCPARKQVERSRSDPNMFIITFTSDHNHPAPTHRNSLAGSTRQKLTPPPPTAATPPELSPTTPLTNTSLEEEGSSGAGQHTRLEDEVDQDDMFMELAELYSPPETDTSLADNWFSDVSFPPQWLAAGSS